MNRAVLALGLLAVSACDVTHLALPEHPTIAQEDTANKKLAGQSAEVSLIRGQDDVRESVVAAHFEGQGNVALAWGASLDSPESNAPAQAARWTTVPVGAVREISTVDHARGAEKGFLYGGLVGFGVTLPTVAALASQPTDCTEFCIRLTGPEDLAVGAIVGLVVGVVTGAVGAAVGAAVGDGTTITVVPDETHPASPLASMH